MGIGVEPLLVGRMRKNSPKVGREYPIKRFRYLPDKGALFYAALNLRLFWFLLRTPADVIHANDLDTLPAAWLAARLKRTPLVYDTHEYFCGVPELAHRPLVRGIWRFWERLIFPRLHDVFTVNASIASLYENDYGKRPMVVRNVPRKPTVAPLIITRKEAGLPEGVPLLVAQGSGLNVDRGLEEALEALGLLPGVHLVLIGSGDVLPHLKQEVVRLQLAGRVHFLPRMPYEDMMARTRLADAGLTLDKDTNINYRFSLPNKVFDYMAAGIPVVASPVVEVAAIVNQYNAGEVIDAVTPQAIAAGVKKVLEQGKDSYAEGLKRGSTSIHWDAEFSPMEAAYVRLLGVGNGARPSRSK